MADSGGAWESESGEDDSFSLTSTKASEHSEDHQFEVAQILAERGGDREKEFLVEWTGYPEERHLWMTMDFFDQCDGLFEDWHEHQKRIKSGFERPFDIEAWEARMQEWEEAREMRKDRRARKRRRLELQVIALTSACGEDTDLTW